MLNLTNENYHSTEANREYWSVSLFKAFDRCEACGLATVNGDYERENTTSLLVGSYVDSYFSGEIESFKADHPEIFNSRTGELKADYKKAEELIRKLEGQPLMIDYLTGDKQKIMTGELFGVPWKIKIDVHGGNRLIDLKVVKDFESIYQEGFGRRSWIEYWGYDIQGAIYQKIEQKESGRPEPLPFYLAAITKERIPDIAVIEIPQHILDTALKVVEAKIERFDLIKTGEVDPIRCGHCDYCKSTKILTAPEIFDNDAA